MYSIRNAINHNNDMCITYIPTYIYMVVIYNMITYNDKYV